MVCKILIIFIYLLLDINASNSTSNKSVEKIIGTRIINGYVCNSRKAPVNTKFMMAFISYWGRHSCGGSLISSNWILTAAHCVDSLLMPTFVIDGFQRDKLATPKGSLGWFAPMDSIRGVYKHPDYNNKGGLKNDIALVFLYNSIQESENIKYVKLPDTVISGDVSDVCNDGTAIGWGLMNQLKNTFPQKLMCVDLKISSSDECPRNFTVYDAKFNLTQKIFVDSATTICTEPSFNKDVCFGDSGGPLTCGGIQYGIVSHGQSFKCAEGSQNFYTRVDKYLDFINETMKNNVLRKSPLNISVILLFNLIFCLLF